jgi:glycerophosphoryl diester phosphodiesterase
MFECDVKLAADGVPFLMHDATLERTTNGRGTGGDLAWGELAKLDAGSWHSRAYAGEPLPAFEAIARYCIANGHFLNIEIKPTPGDEANTGKVVAEHAARLWAGEDVPPFLTSFRPESLQAAMQAAPALPRGLLVDTLWEGWFGYAQQLQCVAVVCNHALWDEALVKQVHDAGMKCLSYTVNDEWAAKRLIDLGTDGIITDRVDLFSPR